MTDNEIIKALGCCGSENCRGCPYRKGKCHKGNPMIRDARDLIKRQQAEIEHFRDLAKMVKSEAITEFAEMLNRNTVPVQIGSHSYNVITTHGINHYINHYVKEMTEGKKCERLTERIGNGIRYDNGKYIVTCYPENKNLTPVDKMAVRLCELEDKLPTLEMELQVAKEAANSYKLQYGNLRMEIAREFADRLKADLFYKCGDMNYTETCEARRLIDNLVKEMEKEDE